MTIHLMTQRKGKKLEAQIQAILATYPKGTAIHVCYRVVGTWFCMEDCTWKHDPQPRERAKAELKVIA